MSGCNVKKLLSAWRMLGLHVICAPSLSPLSRPPGWHNRGKCALLAAHQLWKITARKMVWTQRWRVLWCCYLTSCTSDGQNRQIYSDAKATGCQPRSGLEAAKKDFLIDMDFFRGGESALELVLIVVEPWEYTEVDWVVHFKWVNCELCISQ